MLKAQMQIELDRVRGENAQLRELVTEIRTAADTVLNARPEHSTRYYDQNNGTHRYRLTQFLAGVVGILCDFGGPDEGRYLNSFITCIRKQPADVIERLPYQYAPAAVTAPEEDTASRDMITVRPGAEVTSAA